jgi:putative membrane protein
MVQWNHWHTEPALLIGILLVVWAFLVLAGPLRNAIAPDAEYPRKELGFFLSAVLLFYISVGSPLDAMGEGFLFSAHMVQHNLLMYAVSLLTIVAIPPWLIDGLMNKHLWFRAIFRKLVHPLIAGFLFTFTFCIWHFPVLYELALHNKVAHMVEHLTMYGSSVLAFWPILSRSQEAPRIQWGLQILYIFLLMVAQIPLFGILTFSTEVLYPTYELAPRISFLDPMADQVTGGLLMKVANMVLSLCLLGRAFYKWSQEQ